MTDPVLAALRWQFEMVWALAEVHLPALTDEMCLWEPGPGAWTARLVDGAWVTDWADEEPEAAPPTTIAWVAWQIVWWWSETLARAAGEVPPGRLAVKYPGSAEGVRVRLTALAAQWRALLASLDGDALARPSSFPWPDEQPFARTVAWVHGELMKNIAEIGLLRHIHQSHRR